MAKATLYHIDMTLGKRIKLARVRCKKTQQDVADYFGVTAQAISEWERDEGSPEYEKLRQLPSLLETTADYLLNGEGKPPEPQELQLLFEGLRGRNRRQATRLLQALADDRDEVA